MKISVIVPVYNTSKYLEDCLNSLVNQTFKDMEIICVNDGSTDNSLEILNKYHSVKIITQENQGLSVARNTGIDAASGEYIGFVDSDDWVDLDFFEKLYNSITSTDSDIAAATIFRGEDKYRVKYTEEKIYTELSDKIKACNIPNSCYVWNKLYKAELVKNNKFKPNVYFEDMIWMPYVLEKSSKMVTAPNTVYHYRRNSNSIVKKKPSQKKQEDFYNAKKELVKFFDDNNLAISDNERHINKEQIFWGKILVLKIKEYNNILEYYLFGFIPIYKKSI